MVWSTLGSFSQSERSFGPFFSFGPYITPETSYNRQCSASVYQTQGAASDHGDGDGDGDHSVHGAPGSWCRWCRLELTMEGVVAILSFTTGPRAYVTYYCCWSKSTILGQKFIFLIYCVTKPMVKICA